MNNPGFSYRKFTAFITLGSFLIMTVTGLASFFSPRGRIANWVDWHFLGITKAGWVDIHVASCLLFVVAGIVHIYFNWKPLIAYIRDKLSRRLKITAELIAGLAVSAFFVIGATYYFPPISYIVNLRYHFKDTYWVTQREYQAPIGHAEELSLKAFTKNMGIDLNKAMAELKSKGIRFDNPEDSLEAIARANNTSSLELYRIIKKPEPKRIEKGKGSAGRDWVRGKYSGTGIGTRDGVRGKYSGTGIGTRDWVREKYSGTGIGRKTLAQICRENDLDTDYAKEKLLKNNMTARNNERLKAIAERHGIKPIDVLRIILD